ncbi:AAA family ATPase, partial [Pseudomonas aeruginosa]
AKKYLNLEAELHKRVIGQDQAVSSISRAIRRNQSVIRSHKRPIGSFMFLGPTGVGKTELAKALAEVLFDDESALIR